MCRWTRCRDVRRTGSARRAARAIPKSRCRATCTAASAAIRGASSSATKRDLDALLADIGAHRPANVEAAPLVDGIALSGHQRSVVSPIDGAIVGSVVEADEAIVIAAMTAAAAGFDAWDATPVDVRAAALARAAHALEDDRGRLIALLQSEGGKTLDDAVAEVREAADFCRYYAQMARQTLRPQPLAGPTGESNELRYRGRGVFVCISPWNFPLAIFTGQVVAALAAGNAVVAKPAEQTPLVAAEAVRLLHAAGVPPSALHLVPGDGRVGALLGRAPECRGRRLHRLDRDGARDQPRAGGESRRRSSR